MTNETYLLFELELDHVLVGQRPTADDWPPEYHSWKPAPAAEPAGSHAK